MIVGSITINKSNDLPVKSIIASVQIMEIIIIINGITTPHQLLKEIYKNPISKIIEVVIKTPSSDTITSTK